MDAQFTLNDENNSISICAKKINNYVYVPYHYWHIQYGDKYKAVGPVNSTNTYKQIFDDVPEDVYLLRHIYYR